MDLKANYQVFETDVDGGEYIRYDGTIFNHDQIDKFSTSKPVDFDIQRVDGFLFALNQLILLAPPNLGESDDLGSWPSGRLPEFDEVGEFTDVLGQERLAQAIVMLNTRTKTFRFAMQFLDLHPDKYPSGIVLTDEGMLLRERMTQIRQELALKMEQELSTFMGYFDRLVTANRMNAGLSPDEA